MDISLPPSHPLVSSDYDDIDDESLDALSAHSEFADLDAGDGETSQLYEHYRIPVDKNQKMVRVDKFLFDQLSGISRNRIQNAADAGFIFANDRPVKRSYKVKPFDVIKVMLNRPPYNNDILPEDIKGTKVNDII